ncbi:hypothetical protein Sd1012_3061 [Shigella dysenteriae 1012]|nr:hypothetical protein Sd1012_3061 [Shigella dysenteriae 1012]
MGLSTKPMRFATFLIKNKVVNEEKNRKASSKIMLATNVHI